MKIGSLVKILGEKCIDGSIFGWYETENGEVSLHLFEDKEIYGIFFGKPILSNETQWYNVLVGDRMFLFMMKYIEAATKNKPNVVESDDHEKNSQEEEKQHDASDDNGQFLHPLL